MPAVLLLTTAPLPHPDLEIEALAQQLRDLGVEAQIKPWAEVENEYAAGFDLAVLRSTWDYFVHLDRFEHFVRTLPIPLLNPYPVLRWNWHKSYLLELRDKYVPVIPTSIVTDDSEDLYPQVDEYDEEVGNTPLDDVDDEPMMPDMGPDVVDIVIKPAVSAGAIGVGRFHIEDPAALAFLSDTEGDALVQPYLPEIDEGEISVIFIGGVYSHAVRKVPAHGDFRVQVQHGGVNTAHEATPEEIALAARALSIVPADLLYGRVDLVHTATGPLVMELELIEPELFLPLAPGATERLARAIIDRL